MSQSVQDPLAFNQFSRTVIVNNTGTASANNVEISIPLMANMVFFGGEEFIVNSGDYSPYGQQIWTIDRIEAGQDAVIQLFYFPVQDILMPGYAQVVAMDETDIDSTPNNGTPPIKIEDDEANTVIINIPPLLTLNCPSDFTIVLPTGQETGSVFYDYSATTDCSDTDISYNINGFENGELVGVGTYLIIIGATDNCGRYAECGFFITVINKGLSFDCPEDITFDFTPSTGTSFGPCQDSNILPPFEATTSCPSGNISIALDEFSIFSGSIAIQDFSPNTPCGGSYHITGYGEAMVNFTATDDCGGVSTCTYKVTRNLVPNYVQYIDCPTVIQVMADQGAAGAIVDYEDPTYVIFCNGELDTLSGGFINNPAYFSGNFLPIGEYTVNLTAFCGSTVLDNCSFQIKVLPFSNQTSEINFDCPVDITIALAPFETVGEIVYDFDATTDCPGGEITYQVTGPPNGAVLPFDDYSISITAADNCGRVETCSFVVSLETTDPAPTQVICPDDITVTATDANGAIVTFEDPTVISECGASLNNTFPSESGSLFPIGTTEVNFNYVENGPELFCGGTGQCEFNITVLPPNGSGGGNGGNNGIDLELTMNQNIETPSPFTTFERVLTVVNTGTVTATNIGIDIPLFDGMVYSGGNEASASLGTFVPFNNFWTIASLNAGQTATISLRYFSLQTISSAGYAQVISMDGTDTDSTPNNGTPPSVNEDDEASTANTPGNGGGDSTVILPDLTISNFEIANSIVINQLTDYSFDLNNIGTAIADGDYRIEFYLSSDNTLSPDDTFVGDITTGNTFIGTIANVDAQLLPQFISPGNYNLIVYIDSEQDIEESNEVNNISSYPVTVVNGGNIRPDLNLSAFFEAFDQNQYEVYSITYIIKNQGTLISSNIEVSIPQVAGAVYSGGNEFVATQGDFGIYFDDVWRVGSMSPGEEAELTIKYYKLSPGQNLHYGQVSASSGSDPDSTPGNGVFGIVNEDDEVSIRTNNLQPKIASSDKSRFDVLGVYPNPSSGENLYVEIKTDRVEEREIQIYDALGKLVVVQTESFNTGVNKIKLNADHLPSGYYQILVSDVNMRFMPTRFIIQRM